MVRKSCSDTIEMKGTNRVCCTVCRIGSYMICVCAMNVHVVSAKGLRALIDFFLLKIMSSELTLCRTNDRQCFTIEQKGQFILGPCLIEKGLSRGTMCRGELEKKLIQLKQQQKTLAKCLHSKLIGTIREKINRNKGFECSILDIARLFSN